MNEFILTAHGKWAGMLIKGLPMLLNLLPSSLLMSKMIPKPGEKNKLYLEIGEKKEEEKNTDFTALSVLHL